MIILSQRKEVQILSLEYVCESVRNPSYTHTHPHTIDIIFQIRAMLLLYTTKQSNRLGEKIISVIILTLGEHDFTDPFF